jgi:hypothetical protein
LNRDLLLLLRSLRLNRLLRNRTLNIYLLERRLWLRLLAVSLRSLSIHYLRRHRIDR